MIFYSIPQNIFQYGATFLVPGLSTFLLTQHLNPYLDKVYLDKLIKKTK